MSASIKATSNPNSQHYHYAAVYAAKQAAKRIAPIWPLDKTVAVNPWWEWRDVPIEKVAAQLGYLADVSMLMPKSYYQQFWQKSILPQHVQQAIQERNSEANVAELVTYLQQEDLSHQWHNLSQLLDAYSGQINQASDKTALNKISYAHMPWADEIVQQISQSCGLFFSYPERLNVDKQGTKSFYQFWLELVRQDVGIPILMGQPALKNFFKNLPENPEAVISIFYEQLKDALAIHSNCKNSEGEYINHNDAKFNQSFENYCLALLLDVNGWAAVFAQRQEKEATAALLDSAIALETNTLSGSASLLAVRLAWDWAIWWLLDNNDLDNNDQKHKDRPDSSSQRLRSQFIAQFTQQKVNQTSVYQQQQYLWIWQSALEISVQQGFETQLLSTATNVANAPTKTHAQDKPTLQAVFCIDVRSEPMRRALEAVSPDIQTLGFAGFFGLSIAYDPISVDIKRPQLPALLSPTLIAKPILSMQSKQHLLRPILRSYSSIKSSSQASTNFGWVEAKGLFDGFRMLGQSFGLGHKQNPQDNFDHIEGWQLMQNNQQLKSDAIAAQLAGVLTHMGLSNNFASRVLLVAHASATCNNPMTAGLDCGACGGQSGEVNVRVLAYFLNQQAVRQALKALSIVIPDDTQFIACLHNTTTDDIQWFDAPTSTGHAAAAHKDAGQSNHSNQTEFWHAWLAEASNAARSLRTDGVNISAKKPALLARAFKQLSQDWAQLRPEWGLANNAAFIVAPRSATRELNLHGRAFLHDYIWQSDTHCKTLELIITAPMIVTQWINFQYYASVTDNLHYGSGNKLLHNVVGGNVGVFEGNGGDLRIGLPMQSVHDGKHWRHQPVRLNVYIAAPQHSIAAIVAQHAHVKALIDNQWLYLFQWDINNQQISQYLNRQWHTVSSPIPANITEQHA